MKILGSFIILAVLAGAGFAQKPVVDGPSPVAVKTAEFAAENELAKLAFQAHGGDKLRAMKTLVVRGSVDTTTSAFAQTLPGSFSMAISGAKYFIDMQNPVQSFKQTFDGAETYSTLRGITLPPVTSLGLPLLQKLCTTGYVVTSLPANSKKKRGFRMTAPDGVYTDFFVAEKTNQISGYESSFTVNGNSITTSAVIDKYRVVDGISVPEKYAQRFDLGQFTAYAEFKAKEIEINREVDDGVFSEQK